MVRRDAQQATWKQGKPFFATTSRRPSDSKSGEAIDTPPRSLILMFGPQGNPQAKNLFSVIGYLQKQAGLQLHVTG